MGGSVTEVWISGSSQYTPFQDLASYLHSPLPPPKKLSRCYHTPAFPVATVYIRVLVDYLKSLGNLSCLESSCACLCVSSSSRGEVMYLDTCGGSSPLLLSKQCRQWDIGDFVGGEALAILPGQYVLLCQYGMVDLAYHNPLKCLVIWPDEERESNLIPRPSLNI